MKNVVYQILLALSAVALFFGLGNLTGLVDYLLANLDQVWAAALSLIGIGTGLWLILKPAQPGAQDAVQDTVKSVLLAVAAVAGVLGLAKLTEVVNYLLTNLETIWSLALVIIGFIGGLISYFKTKV